MDEADKVAAPYITICTIQVWFKFFTSLQESEINDSRCSKVCNAFSLRRSDLRI